MVESLGTLQPPKSFYKTPFFNPAKCTLAHVDTQESSFRSSAGPVEAHKRRAKDAFFTTKSEIRMKMDGRDNYHSSRERKNEACKVSAFHMWLTGTMGENGERAYAFWEKHSHDGSRQ
nr:hypothetical protein Iba_chr10eCG16110 [Ipomoea batatas]